MIRVRITVDLIERIFTTGYRLEHTTEVISGIPALSKLVDVHMENDIAVLSFTDPIPGPDRDCVITLRTTVNEYTKPLRQPT